MSTLSWSSPSNYRKATSARVGEGGTTATFVLALSGERASLELSRERLPFGLDPRDRPWGRADVIVLREQVALS
jgi:hypothetical protein